MKVSELLLLNKQKYTKVFIIENDEDNKAVFTEVKEDNIDKEKLDIEAKDYFLLDREGINEIFGNADKLEINKDDQVLMIGL